jgi:hypothetical protein
LQRFADDSGLEISICHFPPATSKWNKIEHRLWSFIAKNWRGRPLVSHEVIINSIAETTTSTGLKVYAQLDERDYPPKASTSATSSWPPSTCTATTSTANGTTPSNPQLNEAQFLRQSHSQDRRREVPRRSGVRPDCWRVMNR